MNSDTASQFNNQLYPEISIFLSNWRQNYGSEFFIPPKNNST